MTLCHFFIKQKSLKASDLNGFQTFYSSQVSKTGLYHNTHIKTTLFNTRDALNKCGEKYPET